MTELCSTAGCEKPRTRKFSCERHYVPAFKRPRSTEAERFWRKVRVTPGCWQWTAGLIGGTGYGAFSTSDRKSIAAHRWAYLHLVGPIDSGKVIDHTCHNRTCVNPDHLRMVTQGENVENHAGPNAANSSGIRGVYFETGTGRWVAQVKSRRFGLYFERFPTKELAAEAVIEARNRMFTHNDLDRVA